MKRTLSVIVIITLILAFILPINSFVFAATPTFALDTNSTMKTVTQNNEFVFYFGVKNFSGFDGMSQKGIAALRGDLIYDTNVFEEIIEKTNNGLYAGFQTKTREGLAPLQKYDGWAGLTYNHESKKFVINKSAGDYFYENGNVMKITLKVKANAPKGETSITIANVEGGNGENVFDIKPSTDSIVQKVTVIGGVDTDPKPGPAPDPFPYNFGGYFRMVPEIKASDAIAMLKANTGFNIDTIYKWSYNSLSNLVETALNPDDYVISGNIIKANDKAYVLIPVGDLDSNGMISANDLAVMLDWNVPKGNLTFYEQLAADTWWDEELTSADITTSMSLNVYLGSAVVTQYYGTAHKPDGYCVPVKVN